MQFTVVDNRNMTSEDEEKDVYFIRLTCEEPVVYAAGDWLQVASHNRPSLVDFVLELLGLSGDESFDVRRVGERPIRQALLENFELTQLNPAILNRIQREYDLHQWADRNAMMQYAEGRDIVDLLQAFPHLRALGLAFCEMLSPLAPRFYSIASSQHSLAAQDYDGRMVDLVYRKVAYRREGRDRLGVTTCQLSDLKAGDVVEADFCENKVFKLPEDLAHNQQPLIMVGAGTGIAPYIGFLEEIAYQHPQHFENTWLFFGETREQTCFLCQEQLTFWEANGLQLYTAFSRDQPEKRYVQDLLWQHKEAVWQALEAGGIFYICGDKSRMAKDVEQVMKRILVDVGKVADPDLVWKEWRRARKVQSDVW